VSAPRLERRDVAALREIVARRALRRPGEREERGAWYVVPGHEDDPHQVHSATPRTLVLRSRSGGFLVFTGEHRPEPEWWCDEVPQRTPDEARAVLADYDRRRGR